jgi:ubiquitin thioesterase OTU1
VFQRHEIPSDNSCLFHACGLLSGMGDANKMRRIAANLIDKDSSTFSDAILGQPREKYKSWILESSSWGGAIELGVLSAALGIELVAIEVRGGHVYRFGQGAAAGLRGFLVFDGVHYDVIYASNSSRTVTKYLFSIDDDKAQSSALKIVDELRRLRQFVDTSSFTIVCGSCNLPLKGEAEARAHATSTGHVDFREVPR